MTVFSIVFGIAVCVFEEVMVYTVCQTFLERRFSSKCADISVLAGLSLILFFVNRQHSSVLNFTFGIATALSLALLLFYGLKKEKIYCCILACLVIFATEYIGFRVLGSDLSTHSFSAMVFTTLAVKLTAFIILQWICRSAKAKTLHFIGSTIITWCFFLYPVSLTILLIGLRYSNVRIETHSAGQILLIAGLLLLLFSNMLLFFLYDYIIRISDQMREYEARQMKDLLMQQHYASLQEISHRYASILHDVNNYIRTVQTMQLEEQSAQIQHTSESLMQEISGISGLTYCNSPLINAVLHEKKQEAVNRQIRFEVFVEPFFPDPAVDDSDLISLLCNLLDNAVEAAVQCEDPFIKVALFVNNAQQLFKICNSSPHKPLAGGPRFLTTKADTQNHGFGIARVESIAEKYGGVLRCKAEDSGFTATVVLPLKRFSDQLFRK